jgi:hypothetical protein
MPLHNVASARRQLQRVLGKVSGSATLRLICERLRSQWQSGLKSSPSQALGSWVRIPLETWMSVCNSSMLVLSCVSGGLLRQDCSLVQGILPTLYKIHCYSDGKQVGGPYTKGRRRRICTRQEMLTS